MTVISVMCTVECWSKVWEDFLALADVKHRMTLHLLFVSETTVLLKVFSFGFLENSEKVRPESSTDTCVGEASVYFSFVFLLPGAVTHKMHVPTTCWLLWKPCWLPPCEPLSGWPFQGAVGSQGCPGLRCGDRCGIMQWPHSPPCWPVDTRDFWMWGTLAAELS